MAANSIFGETAKYDQKSLFTHFQILLEMGREMSLTLLISDI